MLDSKDEDSEKILVSLFIGNTELATLGKIALQDDWQDYLILDAAMHDVGSLAQAYFRGFDQALNDDENKGNDFLVKWVRKVDRRRSLWNISSVTATSLCAVLESFLQSVGHRWINNDVVAKMRATPRGPELPPDEQATRKRLRVWLKPSTIDGGDKWIGRLEEIFGVKLDEVLARELVSMVSQRNRFVHERRPVRDDEYQPPSPAKPPLWLMAVWVLGQTVLRTVTAGHLARRQAELHGLLGGSHT